MGNYLLLAAGFIIILTVLFLALKLATTPLRRYLQIKRLQRNGRQVTATVTESKALTTLANGTVFTSMKLQFPNLSGSLITDEMSFVDSYPERKRFVPGAVVPILIDPAPKRRPAFITAESQPVLNIPLNIAFLICWAAAVYGCWYWLDNALYQTGGEITEIVDEGFIAVIICVGILLLTGGIIKGVMKKFSSPSDDLRIKYYGIRTTATVTGYAQTGTLINDNPVVRFELRFKDQRGQDSETSVKQLVDLVHIGQLPAFTQTDILYLPDNHHAVIMLDDVNGKE